MVKISNYFPSVPFLLTVNYTSTICLCSLNSRIDLISSHTSPVLQKTWKNVDFTIQIYSLRSSKWGHQTWRPVSKHDVVLASIANGIDALSSLSTYQSLSYNITGESAPIFLQSKKCRQKHGGFQHLLTPIGVPLAQGIYH